MPSFVRPALDCYLPLPPPRARALLLTAPPSPPLPRPCSTPPPGTRYWALFNEGVDDGADTISQEEQVAVGAALGTVAIVGIVLGVAVAVCLVCLVTSTLVGIWVRKRRAFNVDEFGFTGGLEMQTGVARGQEVDAPAWSLEKGGTGVPPSQRQSVVSKVRSMSSRVLGRIASMHSRGSIRSPGATPMTDGADAEMARANPMNINLSRAGSGGQSNAARGLPLTPLGRQRTGVTTDI